MCQIIHITVFTLTIFQAVVGWEVLPNIPSGRRSEYYVLHENGGYKYGYDTGDGIAAKQAADTSNQVEGHYFYKSPSGKDLDLKYTAGVQGFVPEGLEDLQKAVIGSEDIPQSKSINYEYPSSNIAQQNNEDDLANTGDSSYSFNIDTDNYKRQESSDAVGNVQGSYSYTNNAGTHDLRYVAGSSTGFLATGGSLSQPNGLVGKSSEFPAYKGSVNPNAFPFSSSNSFNTDGSYAFGFSTDEQSRQESSDSNGNVKGSYAYKNNAGNHDLSYVAGAETGFQPTGGSLAVPNGLSLKSISPVIPNKDYNNQESSVQSSVLNPDGSYSFSFSSGDQSRNEKSDSSGNVQGSYSYRNQAGNHDLSYVAGTRTGFQVTGGSLAIPNGLSSDVSSLGKPSNILTDSTAPITYTGPQPDGSYSFGFSTSDQSRNEQADSTGTIKGSYSYRNNAGAHDLSYVSGSATGFQVTGGSLASPQLLSPSSRLSQDQSAGNGLASSYSTLSDDGSYSFGFATAEQSRNEEGDASNNVKGKYSYRNSAGNHDLSYVAGADTGFVAIGGSLSIPNGLNGLSASNIPSTSSTEGYSSDEEGDEADSGDASYSFNIDTDNYQRKETSDATGNVQGSFSYKNNAGTHDLSYIAGSNTGFVATGGSLRIPPGLTTGAEYHSLVPNAYLPPNSFSTPPLNTASVVPSTKTAYSIGNLAVRTYLPPNNEKRKFGYILDTKS